MAGVTRSSLRSTPRLVALAASFLLLACPGGDPLTQGCRYATGLTSDCAADDGGTWRQLPGGFVTEQFGQSDSVSAEITEDVRQLAAGNRTLAQRTRLDAFDRFIINRYLFSYSERNVVNDCISVEARERALAIITMTDSDGNLAFLQIGAGSALTSRVFETLFASVELKAALETDLTQALGDPASAKVAASAAYNAMKQKLEQDVAVGTYRYITVRSFPELWRRLTAAGLINRDCDGQSVGLGMVVVGLDKRDNIVERATGSDLRVALDGAVAPAKLTGAVATAQATLNAHIARQSQRSLTVTLDQPAVRPLRWKPDPVQVAQ
jgi:hypothetical protein